MSEISNNKRTMINKSAKKELKTAIKLAKYNGTIPAINAAVSKIDSSLSKGIISNNKAAKLKSKLHKIAKNSDATVNLAILEANETILVEDNNLGDSIVENLTSMDEISTTISKPKSTTKKPATKTTTKKTTTTKPASK